MWNTCRLPMVQTNHPRRPPYYTLQPVIIKNNQVEQRGKIFPIRNKTVYIGKSDECSIKIKNEAILSRHALLEVDVENEVYIKNLSPENTPPSVYVNFQSLQSKKKYMLSSGEIFQILNYTFYFDKVEQTTFQPSPIVNLHPRPLSTPIQQNPASPGGLSFHQSHHMVMKGQNYYEQLFDQNKVLPLQTRQSLPGNVPSYPPLYHQDSPTRLTSPTISPTQIHQQQFQVQQISPVLSQNQRREDQHEENIKEEEEEEHYREVEEEEEEVQDQRSGSQEGEYSRNGSEEESQEEQEVEEEEEEEEEKEVEEEEEEEEEDQMTPKSPQKQGHLKVQNERRTSSQDHTPPQRTSILTQVDSPDEKLRDRRRPQFTPVALKKSFAANFPTNAVASNQRTTRSKKAQNVQSPARKAWTRRDY
eukprot:TRINITY_DN95_c1_g3_i1.p1 TRINITY_DN95_c1_g3~~TRINITY_DN95_c1_g3_i1.p1  ORF type:complete len:417 (+),score=141.35 TRINITY_DN95_c1_g3_i1:54-1304(+)